MKPWGMKLLLVILAFVCLAVFAHSLFAAQLEVDGTAPNMDNSGSCDVPVLVPMVPSPLKIHFRWWQAGADSVAAVGDSIPAVPGDRFSFRTAVPAGVYRVLLWPADDGGAGCDTTITLQVPKDKPDKVRDARKP